MNIYNMLLDMSCKLLHGPGRGAEFLTPLILFLHNKAGQIPWSAGYETARTIFLQEQLSNLSELDQFTAQSKKALPVGYGFGLDERCVEIPWAMGKLLPSDFRILDAGSGLNHPHILNSNLWKNRKLDIMTLAPEPVCEWGRGISYLYGDLRDTCYKGNVFDVIFSISTLEHIGMNNRKFSKLHSHEEHDLQSVFTAFKELKRILKVGGRLVFTVPYGIYEDHGSFQQFDKKLLDLCADAFAPSTRSETFFLYSARGWKKANESECLKSRYAKTGWSLNGFKGNDNAAAARCVACCEWGV